MNTPPKSGVTPLKAWRDSSLIFDFLDLPFRLEERRLEASVSPLVDGLGRDEAVDDVAAMGRSLILDGKRQIGSYATCRVSSVCCELNFNSIHLCYSC